MHARMLHASMMHASISMRQSPYLTSRRSMQTSISLVVDDTGGDGVHFIKRYSSNTGTTGMKNMSNSLLLRFKARLNALRKKPKAKVMVKSTQVW